MLYWALIFFICSVISALLGFGGLQGAPAVTAQVLFVIYLILFLIFFVGGLIWSIPASKLEEWADDDLDY